MIALTEKEKRNSKKFELFWSLVVIWFQFELTEHDHVCFFHCSVEGTQEDMVEVTEMAVLTGA